MSAKRREPPKRVNGSPERPSSSWSNIARYGLRSRHIQAVIASIARLPTAAPTEDPNQSTLEPEVIEPQSSQLTDPHSRVEQRQDNRPVAQWERRALTALERRLNLIG